MKQGRLRVPLQLLAECFQGAEQNLSGLRGRSGARN